MPHIYLELGFTFFISLSILFMMRKVAQRINLVDKPNERKQHTGAIPLVGGISICIVFMHFLVSHPELLPNYKLYLLSIFILTLVGAIDDRIDLSFKVRLIVQAALSVAMMMIADIQLHQLGNMFGFGQMNLSAVGLGYVITVLAVIGAINAFNMVDGIDGLLGGLSIVTFAGLGSVLYIDGQTNLAYLCVVLIVIILPYVLLNLGVFTRRYKVFMGDAGSMLIGFTVIWFLLLASQNGTKAPLRPVTALWLIAVPLMDMTTIMIRRIRRGDSPFKPDREHLHHIFQRLGFSSLQTLLIICGIATAYAVFGIYGEVTNIPEYVMFYIFIGCFSVYVIFLSNVGKVSAKIRVWRGIS